MPESGDLHVVSDAHPLDWEALSAFEQQLLSTDVRGWLTAVADAACKPRSGDGQIEEDRRGGVLFINGQRGAGKTSFLLTMLQLFEPPGRERSSSAPSPIRGLRVVLPVLDFDPLPRDMPLHGWLLEPWRRLIDDPKNAFNSSRDDLKEQLADLFERAVLGWTPARADSGVVQRALAYREQASGWIDTYDKWQKFINAVVCHDAGCKKVGCRAEHPRLYVVAIDDVDLQVEQVPALLHAIRLFRHPNVVYVLTGDYDHLELLVRLDYEARHINLARPTGTSEHIDDKTLDEIRSYSRQLCAARLQKALPPHAQLSLPLFTLGDVREFVAGASPVHEKLDKRLRMSIWHDAPTTVKKDPERGRQATDIWSLPFVTARQAQHAIDRYLGGPAPITPDASLRFIANLCRTTVEFDNKTTEGPDPLPRLRISGSITTERGPVLRVWIGDGLKVVLSAPVFVFDDFKARTSGDAAHCAVVARWLAEQNIAMAAALNWNPDAAILATDVDWRPSRPNVTRLAVFHWPWLVRLTASQILGLGILARRFGSESPHGTARGLTERALSLWLSSNIRWRLETPLENGERVDGQGVPETCGSLKEFGDALKRLRLRNRSVEVREGVEEWAQQLLVMTAPYFGLPEELAAALRRVLRAVFARTTVFNERRVELVKRQMVGDAIYYGGNKELSSAERATMIDEFLWQRWSRLAKDEKGAFWLGRPPNPVHDDPLEVRARARVR